MTWDEFKKLFSEYRPHIVVAIVVGVIGSIEIGFRFVTNFFDAIFLVFGFPELQAELLAIGTVNTLGVSALSILIGTAAGFVLAYALRPVAQSTNQLLKGAYNMAFYLALAMPAYLILLWTYRYILPRHSYISAVLALSLNLAVFVAKNILTTFEILPRAQIEAARASGASGISLALEFEIPAIIRAIGGPIANEWATTLKLSSLVGIISVYDIMMVAKDAAQLNYDDKMFVVVPLVYFVSVAPLLWLSNYFRRRS